MIKINPNLLNYQNTSRIINYIKSFLRDEYSDYCHDNKSQISIEDFLNLFYHENEENDYTGSGGTNLYVKEKNLLRDIIIVIIN